MARAGASALSCCIQTEKTTHEYFMTVKVDDDHNMVCAVTVVVDGSVVDVSSCLVELPAVDCHVVSGRKHG